MDLSNENMEGVQPMSEGNPELPNGTYLTRIEETDRKAAKDKFDEVGNKLPPNFYLKLINRVYGGPNDGQTEWTILNLWNSNKQAVDIAKSELKSILNSLNIGTVTEGGKTYWIVDGVKHLANGNLLLNRWIIIEKKPGIKDPTKSYTHYQAAPHSMIDAFKHVPPVAQKAPEAAPPPCSHGSSNAYYCRTCRSGACRSAALLGCSQVKFCFNPKGAG